jgi:hypothetical protein
MNTVDRIHTHEYLEQTATASLEHGSSKKD